MEKEKNFKEWNSMKEGIHNRRDESPVYFHEREIWWCRLGINIGFEQDGKGDESSRPVLILKKINKHIFLAVPLSTKIKQNPYYVIYLDSRMQERSAIISQIRLVSAKRLMRKMEQISDMAFNGIKKAIKDMF